MRPRFLSSVVSAVIASGIIIMLQGSATAAVDAVDVAEHMDKTKYTSAEVKGYLKALKDKQVIAKGKISDVLTGKSGTKIVVYVDIPGRSKEFVVDVHTKKPAEFLKGTQVTCQGTYVKYNMFTLNGIGIEGSCAKK